MGLFDFLTATGRIREWQKSADQVIGFLRSMGSEEIVVNRAATACALAAMLLNAETENDSEILLAGLEAVHDPSRRLTREEDGKLSLLNIKLIRLQKRFRESPAQLNQIVATGIPCWLVSFHAAMRPELLATGRDMWAELDRAPSYEVEDLIESLAVPLLGHPIHDRLMSHSIKRLETPALFVRR